MATDRLDMTGRLNAKDRIDARFDATERLNTTDRLKRKTGETPSTDRLDQQTHRQT